jgi:hypothetical protein
MLDEFDPSVATVAHAVRFIPKKDRPSKERLFRMVLGKADQIEALSFVFVN